MGDVKEVRVVHKDVTTGGLGSLKWLQLVITV